MGVSFPGTRTNNIKLQKSIIYSIIVVYIISFVTAASLSAPHALLQYAQPAMASSIYRYINIYMS
jgi:hypothetical protein